MFKLPHNCTHSTCQQGYAQNPFCDDFSEEELKSPLVRVKEDSEKAGSKLNIQKLR